MALDEMYETIRKMREAIEHQTDDYRKKVVKGVDETYKEFTKTLEIFIQKFPSLKKSYPEYASKTVGNFIKASDNFRRVLERSGKYLDTRKMIDELEKKKEKLEKLR